MYVVFVRERQRERERERERVCVRMCFSPLWQPGFSSLPLFVVHVKIPNTQVRTNGRVTTNVGGFRRGQSMLKLENGNIYGFLKLLKKSLTGHVTKWQKMKIVPDRPHPVPMPNEYVTIKCVERVRSLWHPNRSPCFDLHNESRPLL